MHHKKKRKNPIISFIYWIPSLLIMYLIFQFSAADATHSSALSNGITASAVEFLNRLFSLHLSLKEQAGIVSALHTFVRKCGHFLEYMALGFFLFPAFHHTFDSLHRKWQFLFPWIFCFCYAASDEIHQLFVPGRAGMFRDVVLDSIGAAFGILCFLLFCKCKKTLSKVIQDHK